MCHIQGLTRLEALHITGGRGFTEDHFRYAAIACAKEVHMCMCSVQCFLAETDLQALLL
jgi:hypothetical protein